MPHIVVVDLMTFLETKQTRKHFAKNPALISQEITMQHMHAYVDHNCLLNIKVVKSCQCNINIDNNHIVC